MEESNESFQHSTQNDHFIHGDFKLSRSGQIMHTAIGFLIGVLPFPVWLPDCCSVVDDDMLKKTVVCTMLIMNCWSQSAG